MIGYQKDNRIRTFRVSEHWTDHRIDHRTDCWIHWINLTISYSQISLLYLIYLFIVLRRFQHCTGHIKTGSWKGRGNQYIQFIRVLYCKLPTNGKQLPAFPHEAVPGIEPQPQRWEARVLPLCHCGPLHYCIIVCTIISIPVDCNHYC